MDGKVRVPKDNCNHGYENLVSKYREWQMELLERFAARPVRGASLPSHFYA